MKLWTGVTDNGWFNFLAARAGIEEVNFWHPSGRPPFSHLPEGSPFLFKVKAPHHHIAGGGYFVKYESLPLPLAWDAFGVKNGAATYQELSRLVGPLRPKGDSTTPEIGCSILAEPFFWPRSEWIPADDYFASNIVVGKFFDTSDTLGSRLWGEVQPRLAASLKAADRLSDDRILPGYGDPSLQRNRRGQGAFQALVTNAYQRRCAITGESTLPVLEAAHIVPFATDGVNNVYNGLLLRSDFHKLFDAGLVTVTPSYRVEVSNRIKDQWFNGKAYYRLHGQQLASLPTVAADRPRRDLLTWHNTNVFEQQETR